MNVSKQGNPGPRGTNHAIHANRKWEIPKETEKLTVHIDSSLAYEIAQARGQMSRNAWMVQAFAEKLARDAQAAA